MTRLTIGLDDTTAARLAARAASEGVTPEEFASRLLAADLEDTTMHNGPPDGETDAGFEFFDAGSSRVLRGRNVDELLAEGFGQ